MLFLKQWMQKAVTSAISSAWKERSRETKASRLASLIAHSQVGKPAWTPADYPALAQEGYMKNVIVHRCVTLIARSVGSVPWLVYEGNDELDTHPVLDLLNRPNPFQGGNTFMESLVSHLLLSGNAYIEAVSVAGAPPAELYSLRPDRMKVIPDTDGFPQGYTYTVQGQSRQIPTPRSAPSPILHLKFFHPLNDWYGLSPLEPCLHSVEFHNTVANHNLALLRNGGRPSGALMVKNSLSDAQRAQLREDLTALYEGAANAGRMFILEGGDWEWKEMSTCDKDLDFVEGKHVAAREIAQTFGVPPMLVGVPGDATFANYREARFHLWEDTVLPLLDMIVNQLNLWLLPQFGPRLWISYDEDRIPALAPRRQDSWEKISQASFLTLNEKREALGYEHLPGGDTLLNRNTNLIPEVPDEDFVIN